MFTLATWWACLTLTSLLPENRFAMDYNTWVKAVGARYTRVRGAGYDANEVRAWERMQRSFKMLKREFEPMYKGQR